MTGGDCEIYDYRDSRVLIYGIGMVVPGSVLVALVLVGPGAVVPMPDSWYLLLTVGVCLPIFGFRMVLAFLMERICHIKETNSILWIDCLGRKHGPYPLDSVTDLRRRKLGLGFGGGTYEVTFSEGKKIRYAGIISNCDELTELFDRSGMVPKPGPL